MSRSSDALAAGDRLAAGVFAIVLFAVFLFAAFIIAMPCISAIAGPSVCRDSGSKRLAGLVWGDELVHAQAIAWQNHGRHGAADRGFAP